MVSKKNKSTISARESFVGKIQEASDNRLPGIGTFWTSLKRMMLLTMIYYLGN
jgi:hypothetical protein